MGINFNIVKKPKVEEDDGEELELEDDNNSSSSNGYDPKKKMIKFMGIIVVVMIVILIILFVSSLLGKGGKSVYTYSEIENILEKAGKSYFKDHPDYLPVDEGDVIEVDASTLAESGKMKNLSEYPTKSDAVCTGSVKVELVGDDYAYSPVLDCGDKYSTVLFNSKIISDNEIVTTGDGLYSKGGEYIFRGENVNNYVQLDEGLWRIVKITKDDEIVLINEEGVGLGSLWDNRYSQETNYNSGINKYGVSRIKDYLDDIYTNPNEKKSELFLSKKDKTKLVSYDICVGKKSPKSEDKTNIDECKEKLKDQKVGLLTLSDYLYASVDPNCKSVESKSCRNYNYLVMNKEWWLVTASTQNSSFVYSVKSNGSAVESYASSYARVRPVIHLNSNVLYKSGKGTETKPYKVR